MKHLFVVLSIFAASALSTHAQIHEWQPEVTQQQTYTLVRKSSMDVKGGNHDWRTVQPGATETVLDADGPGVISHIWFTIATPEQFHLKRIVLRMYWDGETSPSVEAGRSASWTPLPSHI